MEFNIAGGVPLLVSASPQQLYSISFKEDNFSCRTSTSISTIYKKVPGSIALRIGG